MVAVVICGLLVSSAVFMQAYTAFIASAESAKEVNKLVDQPTCMVVVSVAYVDT